MEIYEKTVEVLEPEVTKLMKFMYFQVSRVGAGEGNPQQKAHKDPTVHILDFSAVSFFSIRLVFLRVTYSPVGDPGQQVSPSPQRMCLSECVYAWSTELQKHTVVFRTW